MSTTFLTLTDNIFRLDRHKILCYGSSMGRKTRKEKIITDLRKQLAVADAGRQKTEDRSEKTELPQKTSTESFTQTQSLYIYPTQLIRKDLTKTIILSILAISLELALFLIFEKKISLPINKVNLQIAK